MNEQSGQMDGSREPHEIGYLGVVGMPRDAGLEPPPLPENAPELKGLLKAPTQDAEPSERRKRKPVNHLNYVRSIVRQGSFDLGRPLGSSAEAEICLLEEEACEWQRLERFEESPAAQAAVFGIAFGFLARVEQTAVAPDDRFASLLDLTVDERSGVFAKFHEELTEVKALTREMGADQSEALIYALSRGADHLRKEVKRAKKTKKVDQVLGRELASARKFAGQAWRS